MPEERHHSDILIASLLLVGGIAIVAILSRAYHAPKYATTLMWAAAAFGAAQLGRRVLDDLALDEVAIAAAVTIAIVMGIHYQVTGRELSLEILLPIAIAEIGAVAGALTSKHRGPKRALIVVANGLAPFGAGSIASGLALIAGLDSALVGLTFFGGCFVGGIVTVRYTRARWLDSSIGQMLVLGAIVAASDREASWIAASLGGAVIGALIGAAAGAIGARLRRRRRVELPEVRVES